MTEPCRWEVEIPTMLEGIKDIKKAQDKQDIKFDKLFKVIDGNGSGGLVTQTALNKASLFRVWGFLMIIGVSIIGGAVKIIFF